MIPSKSVADHIIFSWEQVPQIYISDHSIFSGTWSFKGNHKPNFTIRKFKACFCVRSDVQKRISPEPLKFYSTVVQWATGRLMLILMCIIVLHSQSIDSKNKISQSNIPSG